MKLFLIPGLGYNHRIFEQLKLPVQNAGYINWIDPQPDENISAYAKRLFEPFADTNEAISIIGHSLGGIVAQEIAVHFRIKKVILLSSIKSRHELPFTFKMVKPLMLYKLFTKELSIKTVKYWGANHGFTTDEEKELFKSMVGTQSNQYLQWALKTLSSWKVPDLPQSTDLIQIHGTHDKTFPIHLIKTADHIIQGGSHIMVYKKPGKISEILTNLLTKQG